jgi:dTDP-4-amino-4,6-dideoxygalactose transaminase
MRSNILDVLESGRISYGPYSQQFEQQFAELHNCKYGILSNSGTSSLLVALQTLKEVHNWQNGDEVIVPAITFVATVNVVLQSGLKPVLVDVESDYYGIDVGKVGQVITDRTRCIIPVHTFGQPTNLSKLDYLLCYVDENTNNSSLYLVEDSCESMLVSHHEIPVGSWSNIACFSTYMAHLLTTGVGGIAITNNELYAKTMRSLCNHGLSYNDLSAQEKRYDPWKLHRDFTFERIGHSFRLTELETAIGLAQLDDLPQIIAKRIDNARYLSNGLRQDFLQLPIKRENTSHAWMMYPLVCKQDGIRDKLVRHLNEHGIETRRMLPLVSQPVYKGLWNPDDYPVARWIDDNGFYIGCHQDLTQDDLDYIIEVFEGFF